MAVKELEYASIGTPSLNLKIVGSDVTLTGVKAEDHKAALFRPTESELDTPTQRLDRSNTVRLDGTQHGVRVKLEGDEEVIKWILVNFSVDTLTIEDVRGIGTGLKIEIFLPEKSANLILGQRNGTFRINGVEFDSANIWLYELTLNDLIAKEVIVNCNYKASVKGIVAAGALKIECGSYSYAWFDGEFASVDLLFPRYSGGDVRTFGTCHGKYNVKREEGAGGKHTHTGLIETREDDLVLAEGGKKGFWPWSGTR